MCIRDSIQQSRQFFARGLSFFRPDSKIEASISSSIWPSLPLYIKRHNAAAVVQRNSIDKRYERRLNLFPANSDQLLLHAFRVINSFNTQLVVNTKNDHATARVCESDNLLRDLFSVGKFDLQFEKRVLAASN